MAGASDTGVMELAVRHAVAGDADAIADAHVEAWRVAYAHVVPAALLDDPAFRSSRVTGWHRRLVDGVRPDDWDPHDEVFAGSVDGRVVGFGNVGAARSNGTGRERGPGGELYGFYVHPDAWGTGVADVLIERCHDALAARFEEALLWVLTDNPRARRFYERNGWSCGTGDELVEDTWCGPSMPGMPQIRLELPETQYRRRLHAGTG